MSGLLPIVCAAVNLRAIGSHKNTELLRDGVAAGCEAAAKPRRKVCLFFRGYAPWYGHWPTLLGVNDFELSFKARGRTKGSAPTR